LADERSDTGVNHIIGYVPEKTMLTRSHGGRHPELEALREQVDEVFATIIPFPSISLKFGTLKKQVGSVPAWVTTVGACRAKTGTNLGFLVVDPSAKGGDMPQPLSIWLRNAGQSLVIHSKIYLLGIMHQSAGNRNLAEPRSLAHLLGERPEMVPRRLKDVDASLLGLVQAKIRIKTKPVSMG
jgi:hypothetical protein